VYLDGPTCNNTACSFFPSPNTPRCVGTLRTGEQALEFKIWLEMTNTSVRFEALALVDSGASGDFIDTMFVEKNGIETIGLEDQIPIWNADGTNNQGSPILAYLHMFLIAPEWREKICLEVMQLGN
jgi:hypothetical protein